MSDSVVELSSEPEASVEPESENLCVADNTQWNILKRPANEIYGWAETGRRNGIENQS